MLRRGCCFPILPNVWLSRFRGHSLIYSENSAAGDSVSDWQCCVAVVGICVFSIIPNAAAQSTLHTIFLHDRHWCQSTSALTAVPQVALSSVCSLQHPQKRALLTLIQFMFFWDKSNFNKQFKDLSWVSAVTSVSLGEAITFGIRDLFFFGAEQRIPWPLSVMSGQERFRYFFGTFQVSKLKFHALMIWWREGQDEYNKVLNG